MCTVVCRILIVEISFWKTLRFVHERVNASDDRKNEVCDKGRVGSNITIFFTKLDDRHYTLEIDLRLISIIFEAVDESMGTES